MRLRSNGNGSTRPDRVTPTEHSSKRYARPQQADSHRPTKINPTLEHAHHTTSAPLSYQVGPHTPTAHIWAVINGLQCRVDFLEAAVLQGHTHMISPTHDDTQQPFMEQDDTALETVIETGKGGEATLVLCIHFTFRDESLRGSAFPPSNSLPIQTSIN
jgi:hypothetical protein